MDHERILHLQILDGRLEKLYQEAIGRRETAFASGEKHIDSGFDIFTPALSTIGAGDKAKLRLGIRCALHDANSLASQPYYIYPRSSISKTPLRLANSVGIIDSGYRGELMAVVDNIGPTTYSIAQGGRLFQICAPDLKPFRVKIVDHLNTTRRGSGGFGSTGS